MQCDYSRKEKLPVRRSNLDTRHEIKNINETCKNNVQGVRTCIHFTIPCAHPAPIEHSDKSTYTIRCISPLLDNDWRDSGLDLGSRFLIPTVSVLIKLLKFPLCSVNNIFHCTFTLTFSFSFYFPFAFISLYTLEDP